MASAVDHGIGSLQETVPDLQAHASDLFTMPSQEISMVSGRTTIYRPIDKTNEGPFQFLIEPQGVEYLHLAASRLFLQLKITNADGSPIPATANVAPVNLIGNSLWQSIDIEVSGTPVSELGNMHANYKGYIESLLSYSHPAMLSHLTSSMFCMDTSGKFEDYDPYIEAKPATTTAAEVVGHDPNQGYQDRKITFAKSKSIQLMTPIHCDFLQSDKYLSPGVKLAIRFTRASDKFFLMSPDANASYKIVIEDIKLHIRHVKLTDAILKQHLILYQTQPAIYLINKTVLKTFAYPAGLPSINVANMFTGVLPKTVIVFMVKATAFTGSYTTNPYNFEHFSLSSGALRVNGEQIPSEPYTPDWAANCYTREYRDLFDNIGISHHDMGNLITPQLFSGGVFMMAFDLTPDRCNGRHYHPKQSGVINLDLKFNVALAQPINVLAFATYDAVVLIDKNYKVTTDVSP